MNIEIPKDAEDFVKQQAAAAGFADVQQFVLSLILNNSENISPTDAVTSEPYYEQLVVEGLESGSSTPVSEEHWSEVRERLKQRIAQQGQSE